MPSKYGFGNTRKKSPYEMGKAHYGKDQKNPIMKKSPLEKGKTKTVDKVKAFLGAVKDVGAAGENLGRFSRHYQSRKRAYRRDDAVKKEK